jgi:hypothetical protein
MRNYLVVGSRGLGPCSINTITSILPGRDSKIVSTGWIAQENYLQASTCSERRFYVDLMSLPRACPSPTCGGITVHKMVIAPYSAQGPHRLLDVTLKREKVS